MRPNLDLAGRRSSDIDVLYPKDIRSPEPVKANNL
jgi:hypothetical protein